VTASYEADDTTGVSRQSGTGFLIVATGLVAESRIATARRVRAIASGGNAQRLAREIDRAIAEGGCGLLSFGIAGGLKPGLPPGTIIIPSLVVGARERFATHNVWTAHLRALLPQAVKHAVAGVDAPIATPLAKEALHAATAAAGADMESHVAARAALRAGLPFAVLRVIADPAERALPHAAIVGMGSDGRPEIAAILRSLAQNLSQLAALVCVAWDASQAMAILLRCKRALGPGLGFALLDGS
jgi:adenosylhomocysteine nucleosidase